MKELTRIAKGEQNLNDADRLSLLDEDYVINLCRRSLS